MAKKSFKDLAKLLTERSSLIQEKEYSDLMNGQLFYVVVKHGLLAKIWRRNSNL